METSNMFDKESIQLTNIIIAMCTLENSAIYFRTYWFYSMMLDIVPSDTHSIYPLSYVK